MLITTNKTPRDDTLLLFSGPFCQYITRLFCCGYRLVCCSSSSLFIFFSSSSRVVVLLFSCFVVVVVVSFCSFAVVVVCYHMIYLLV